MYVIGIDVGINGGIVALNGKHNSPHAVDISPMPPNPKKIFEHLLYLGFPNVVNREEVYIFIEDVHSMPTDGVKAAFTFGRGLGHLEGVMAVVGLPEALKVNSRDWMKYFNLKKEKDEKKYDFKKRIKELAESLVERDKRNLITLKTADAFCIAWYGYALKRNSTDNQQMEV